MKYDLKIPKIKLFDKTEAMKFVKAETQKTIDIMTSKVQANVKFGAPVGVTSELRNTIYTSRTGFTGRVYSGVDYGIIIEKGRKKAPVSYRHLVRWVQKSRKGQMYLATLRSNKKYKNITAVGAAVMLARSMGKKARKPNPFFSKGVKRSSKTLTREPLILLEILSRGLKI